MNIFKVLFTVLFLYSAFAQNHVIAQTPIDKRALFLKKIEGMPKRMIDGRELVDTTFREIVVFTILSNNNLVISLANIKKAVYTIQQFSGKFDPNLTLTGNTSANNSFSSVQNNYEIFKSNEMNTQGYQIGIEQMIPLGMTYSVNVGTKKYTPKSITLNADDYEELNSDTSESYYNNYLGLNLNIPVFKLGESNLSNVKVAAENAKRAKYVSKQLINSIISQIGSLYYDFYGLYQEYESQKVRLAYSREMFNEVRTRFELGAADRIKLREAEYLVNIDSQNLKSISFRIIEFDDTIKQALKLEDIEYGIYPLENLQIVPFTGNIAELIEESYRQDSLLKQYENERNINRYQFEQLNKADNPDVTLNLNYTLNSYGYKESQASGNLTKNKTDNYSAALTWKIPLGNNVNESLLNQKIIDTEQSNIRISDRKSSLKLRLKQLTKNLDLLVQEKKTKEISINLALDVLNQQKEKTRMGSGTLIDTLQAQDNLQRARSNHTATEISYAKKLLDIDLLTGNINRKIEFDPEILFTKTPSQIAEIMLQNEIQQ